MFNSFKLPSFRPRAKSLTNSTIPNNNNVTIADSILCKPSSKKATMGSPKQKQHHHKKRTPK